MKTYNSEKIIKKFLTKEEISYIKSLFPAIQIAPKSGDAAEKDGKLYLIDRTYHISSLYFNKDECERACKNRARILRKKIAEAEGSYTSASLLSKIREKREEQKAARREAARREAERQHIIASAGEKNAWAVISPVRTGENIGTLSLRYGSNNSLVVDEGYDYRDGYARSCRWTMVRRSFRLTVKKGWHVAHIGGLLTFIKGTVRRGGQPCEWIEQGRAISDTKTVKGFLVRGEHIEAKDLAEAKRISAQRRSLRCARLLSQRKRASASKAAIEDGTLKITFRDSLAAGNCRPGTEAFRLKYEEAIGHKATSISVADLRQYAKKFNVSYYAERIINHIINK